MPNRATLVEFDEMWIGVTLYERLGGSSGFCSCSKSRSFSSIVPSQLYDSLYILVSSNLLAFPLLGRCVEKVEGSESGV